MKATPLLCTLLLLTACQTVDDHEMAGARPGGKADSATGVNVVGTLGADPVQGVLAGPADRQGWLFYATEGATIDLEVTQLNSSRGLDTILTVHGPRRPDGSFEDVVATDDEAGWGALSALEDLEIAETGFYVAEIAADEAMGDFADKSYGLELRCPEDQCEEQPLVPMPNDIHWVRNSAEYVGATVGTYQAAQARLESLSSAGLLPERWAVALDVDETVLSNAQYQKERAALGLGYSSDSWRAWVDRQEASPIPGAIAFLERVDELGGTIALVTNRRDYECPDTRGNLESEGVPFDILLCRVGVKDKQPRWDSVEDGTASAEHEGAEIVLWVGDNIHDFPGMEQSDRDDEAAFADFGTRFFVISNPMYGSWTRNARE